MNSKLLSTLLLSAGIFISSTIVAQVPVANFSVSSNTICADQPVQVTDMSSNTPSAWSYSVNGVLYSTMQNPEITFTVSGTYSVDLEASNVSGTSAMYSQTVSVLPLPTITVSGNTLVCTSASSTLAATGADTYTWNPGPNLSTITINPAANTVYTLVGTSTVTGCSDSNFVSIVTIPLPTISVSNATICPGQSYTISPSGASSYTYSGGSAIITPASSTNYTVSGTDTQTGCSDSVTISIFVNIVSITANSGSICAGQSFTIMPSGALTYSYSGGSNVVSPMVNTSYTVVGTDAFGCSDATTVTIGVTPSPTILVNSGSICAGQVFSIQASGASNYTISGGSTTVAPLTNTSYVVSGTNLTTGCVGFATLFLTVTPLPVISISNATICAGDVFTLTPSGAATYTFSSGASTVMPSGTTSYSITGTSANGCISQSAAVVTVVVSGTKPTVSIVSSVPGVICAGDNIVLTAGGAGSYSWSTGAITATAVINPTVSTLFLVTGTDVLTGCTGEASILQYVSQCSGIENVSSALQINIYPNPTNGELTIEAGQDMTISVINALGQVALSQQLEAGKTTIHLDDQPSGIYFINLKQNREVKTLLIIKQ